VYDAAPLAGPPSCGQNGGSRIPPATGAAIVDKKTSRLDRFGRLPVDGFDALRESWVTER